MQKYYQTATIFFITLAATVVMSQKPQDSTIIKLSAEIEKFCKEKVMQNASWGICVITADSGKTVFSYNDTLPLIPASTMKAINTAASLSMLGKDFTFKTCLFYDGETDSAGTLHGNVYIKGGGDPSLGSPRTDTMNDVKYMIPRWIAEIKKQGIKKIDGAIVGDAGIFDDSIASPWWDRGDLGLYYGAGSSGLSFHENSFRIIVKAGKKYRDSAVIAETDPPIPYIKIINNVVTGGVYSWENLWVLGSPYENVRLVNGTVPRNKKEFSLRASLPDPSFYCAYSLFRALSDSGIAVKDSATTLKYLKDNGKTESRMLTFFYKQESPPLDTIIFYTNQSSINPYAENILKMLAYEKTGKGSTYYGAQLVTQFWKSRGVDMKGFLMKDGSGLSSFNRVSPRQLAEILRSYIPDSMFPVFYHSLPVAGKSGSISEIFKGTVAENNLRAKSGYMRGLRSYTGYVYNKNNKLLTFGIIVNNHSATPSKMKSMLEKIMVLIAETEWQVE